MAKLNHEEEINLLKNKLKEEKELTSALKAKIELLYHEISKLRFNLGIEKTLNGPSVGMVNAAAFADLFIDPNPIELNCSGEKADTSQIYVLKVLDILAIHSNKRPKSIFLQKPALPKSGGKEKLMIVFEKNDVNFNALLLKIQGRGEHLLRVHNSFAINIYHYTFSKTKTFILHEDLKTAENVVVHEIQIDDHFDKDQYHKRLFEIDKLQQCQVGTRLNIKKIAEIAQLKKDLGID